jgi:tol-pal system protein YbgF
VFREAGVRDCFRDRSILLALSGWGLLSLPACSGSLASLDREVKDLRTSIGEISRSSSAMRTRMEDLENRLLLLQDQIETQKITGMRGGARASADPVPSVPPSLPVVKVAPPAVDADADDTPEAPRTDRRTSMKVDKVLPPSPPPRDIVYQQLDDDGNVVPSKGSKVRIAASEPPQPKPAKPAVREGEESGVMTEYRNALDRYEAGEADDALTAFREFVKKHPKHPYADNAQYWVGECLYDRKEYVAARQEFMKVVSNHPDGNKVPDAMVKAGLCDQMLKRFDEARRMYDTVMLTWPDSPAAAVAMRLAGELP